jgi:hypothetical protein
MLGEGTLLLADRQFVDANLWRQAAATGAQLLWRTKSNAVLSFMASRLLIGLVAPPMLVISRVLRRFSALRPFRAR